MCKIIHKREDLRNNPVLLLITQVLNKNGNRNNGKVQAGSLMKQFI